MLCISAENKSLLGTFSLFKVLKEELIRKRMKTLVEVSSSVCSIWLYQSILSIWSFHVLSDHFMYDYSMYHLIISCTIWSFEVPSDYFFYRLIILCTIWFWSFDVPSDCFTNQFVSLQPLPYLIFTLHNCPTASHFLYHILCVFNLTSVLPALYRNHHK